MVCVGCIANADQWVQEYSMFYMLACRKVELEASSAATE